MDQISKHTPQYRSGMVKIERIVVPRVSVTALLVSPPKLSAKVDARPAVGIA